MGFSVSGGFAVLAVGAFIAFGIFYGAAADAGERVTDAQADAFESRLDQQNTAIAVTNATWYSSNSTLEVVVENTGTTALEVNATDVIADNEYVAPGRYASSAVDGDAETAVWLSGERLAVRAPLSERPDRVTVAVETGVSDWAEVT